ncbi:hypothetical protein CH352_17265 [Leptospira hartskeerlii]|uniref:Lipoprotein n=1 Tax=Leptospira hartskeerlii TaxID=2023177 RepID=A0A2M9XD06_9LEPT|nr:hypothetical protein CH357_11700 [Leptospira hartskeerlii]PJZ32251.1 hypothetical protein CH352_17265 [Leptospira hartskeerlii]
MFVLFILVFETFYSCKEEAGDPNPYADILSSTPLSKIENYVGLESEDWSSRIFNLDKYASDYVNELNRIDGFTESPTPIKDVETFKATLLDALTSQAGPVSSLLKNKLLRIYVCENLGGSAVTGIVRKDGKSVGGFVILDANTLNRNANDWISYKENSAFQKENVKIRIRIEEEKQNTKANALRYILLHEFGHILSETEKIGPSFFSSKRSYTNFEFYKGIWKSEKVSYLDDSVFIVRPQVRFYSESLSLDENWEKIYPILSSTPFPTLYSAANADDFFADSFVSYVHVILEKKPWELEILKNDKPIFKMENDIRKDTLTTQRKIIERIFSR